MQVKQNKLLFDMIIALIVGSFMVALYATVRAFGVEATPVLIQQSVPIVNATPTSEVAIQVEAPAPVNAITPVFDVQAHQQDTQRTLQSLVSTFATEEPNDYSIVVSHIPSGIQVAANETKQMSAASLYKVFAAYEALKLVDDDLLSLSSTLSDRNDQTAGQCITLSIVVSDNPCGRAILITTGLASNDGLAKLRDNGFTQTDLRGDYTLTTARDVAHLFKTIHDGQTLSKASASFLKNILLDQQINDRIPAGLPKTAQAAHKTGDLEGAAHDGGIIYSEKSGDYVLVIMSDIDTSGRALIDRYARMAWLTQRVHAILTEYTTVLNDADPS